MDGTYDAINTISMAHAQGGTTAMIPTTYSSSSGSTFAAVRAVSEAMKKGVNGATILGVHLEGPYIAISQKGAQDEKYIREPTEEETEEMRKHKEIRLITAAPEVRGVLDFAEEMTHNGVIMSIGHSDATISDVEKAVEAGFSHVTHMYNAMSTVKRVGAYRYPGVVEAAYLMDDVSVDFIADGKHIPPYLIKLIIKNKGLEKVNVITDALKVMGLPPGRYATGENEIIVDEGVAWLADRSAFAGSVSSMSSMFKVMVRDVGLPVAEAARLFSTNPASLLGIKTKGRIAIGYDADVTVLNQDFSVLAAIAEGRLAYKQEKRSASFEYELSRLELPMVGSTWLFRRLRRRTALKFGRSLPL